MSKLKIIVRPESSNLWWGIYGFCEMIGWEDLNLFYENEDRIGGVCLTTKSYLKHSLKELEDYPKDKKYCNSIKSFFAQNDQKYWYFYDDKNDEDFYEVQYSAPKNIHNVKPRFTEIWHIDNAISISTIKSGVKQFVKDHLGINECEVEIQNSESFEEAKKAFEETTLYKMKPKISFSNELLNELSNHWKIPEDEVLKKLERTIKTKT